MTAATLSQDAARGQQLAVSTRTGTLWGILPLVLLIYAALLPPEVRLIFAGQNLYAPRLAIFLLAPWIVYQLAKGRYTYRHLDLLILGGAAWMIVSFSVFYDIATGMRRASAMALDIVGPYFIARLCIRNVDDFRRVMILIAPGITVIGLTLLVESVSASHLARPIAADIFGPISAYEEGSPIGEAGLRTDFRLGLMRAYGTFPHPIHGGLLMASLLPLYALSGLRSWPLFLGIGAGLFAVFSGSSAAYLSLFFAFVLIAYDRVQFRIDLIGWKIFLFSVAVVGLAAQFASQNGLIAVLTRNTLNPASARARIYIWEYGTITVADNPAFGIGFSDYDQLAYTGESVDNYWLLLAIRHGIASPVLFLLLAAVLIVSLALQCNRHPVHDRSLMVGLAICLSLLTFMGFTVAFVGSILTWYFVLLGVAAGLTYQTLAAGQQTPAAPGRSFAFGAAR